MFLCSSIYFEGILHSKPFICSITRSICFLSAHQNPACSVFPIISSTIPIPLLDAAEKKRFKKVAACQEDKKAMDHLMKSKEATLLEAKQKNGMLLKGSNGSEFTISESQVSRQIECARIVLVTLIWISGIFLCSLIYFEDQFAAYLPTKIPLVLCFPLSAQQFLFRYWMQQKKRFKKVAAYQEDKKVMDHLMKSKEAALLEAKQKNGILLKGSNGSEFTISESQVSRQIECARIILVALIWISGIFLCSSIYFEDQFAAYLPTKILLVPCFSLSAQQFLFYYWMQQKKKGLKRFPLFPLIRDP